MAEGRVPGEACPIRHHGRNTSRGNRLPRAGESGPRWLATLLERRFSDTRRQRAGSKVHLVRYADDFIITGTSRVLLQTEVQPLVAHFLRKRGLELSHEKTRITHIDDGFDFLGQTVRRFANGKVLIKPSKRSVKTFLAKIQETIDDAGGMTAGDLIRRLNQQIKGWTMYHRYAVSKRIFQAVDDRIFRKLMEMVPSTPSREELEVDQEEILPARRATGTGCSRGRSVTAPARRGRSG